jgi:surface antigen
MKKISFLVFFIFLLSTVFVNAQSVSISSSSVVIGATVTATWSGFTGNVNVAVYKGSTFWLYANTNLASSGSWDLVTTGWEIRSDYKVRVELRSNTSIYSESGSLSVTAAVPLSVSLSSNSVTVGNPVTVTWSGFTGNVNVAVYKGSTFWLYANTNLASSGSWDLVTTGWEIRSDYKVRVELRSNTSIYSESGSLSVTAITSLPDLTVSANPLSIYPSGMQNVQMSVQVNRSGGNLTAGTYVEARLYFSTDNIWDGNDVLLWNSNNATPDYSNSYLNSNGSKSVVATMNLPNVSDSTYYIIAVVDPTNYHSESDETNNQTPYSISITNTYTDKYPYANQDYNSADPWSFYYRECTSYVAFKINEEAGTLSEPYFFTNYMQGSHWGNAGNWASNASSLGYVVDNNPKKGSIAEWNAGELGPVGHVAYVEDVNQDGSVNLTEYNYHLDHNFDIRKSVSDVPRFIHVTLPTGVTDKKSNLPKMFALTQNYPNPFNPSTTINYSLPKEGQVTLIIYNALGSKIATIVDEYKSAGNYSAKFNGTNFASGIYFYRLESNNYSEGKKLILMK